MRQTTVLRQTLASMVESQGDDSLLEMFCSRVADGEDPRDISKSIGLSWFIVSEWLAGGDRMEMFNRAKRCQSDGLFWDGVKIAREANMETLPVDKFQAEFFHKSAERMNPTGWGGKDDRTAGGITVVVNRGLEAKMDGGVLTIGQSQDKGDPVAIPAGAIFDMEGL